MRTLDIAQLPTWLVDCLAEVQQDRQAIALTEDGQPMYVVVPLEVLQQWVRLGENSGSANPQFVADLKAAL